MTLTPSNLFIKMYNMKVLMDADCLIKLTKAGLKRLIVEKYTVFIPSVVKREVVDIGREKGYPDASIVNENIISGKIKVVGSAQIDTKGDQALIELFDPQQYFAVATDDVKLTRFLRLKGIPFILPAVLLFKLLQDREIDRKTAIHALDKLRNFISEDEYSTVRILMEGKA